MKNAWTRNVLISSARTRAIRTKNGNSHQNPRLRAFGGPSGGAAGAAGTSVNGYRAPVGADGPLATEPAAGIGALACPVLAKPMTEPTTSSRTTARLTSDRRSPRRRAAASIVATGGRMLEHTWAVTARSNSAAMSCTAAHRLKICEQGGECRSAPKELCLYRPYWDGQLGGNLGNRYAEHVMH